MPLPYIVKLCTSLSKRNKRPCHNPAVRGDTKCRIHISKSLRGMANPNYRTGRYVKSLPVQLAVRLEQGQRDPELLNLRTEISLVDARLTQLVERLHSCDSEKRNTLLYNLLQQAQAALQHDPNTCADLLEQLQRVLKAARAEYDVWREVDRKLELRMRLVEAERRRLVDAKQMITIEQLMNLLGRVYGIIIKHVPDPRLQSDIAREIKYLTEQNAALTVE